MIVLDCSAAVEMVRGTEPGNALRSLILEGEWVIAPEIFHAELANTLWKYVRIGSLKRAEAFEYLRRAQSLIEEFTRMKDLAPEALAEAARLHHPAYDMFYFVLARRNAATLMTTDKKLMRLCEEQGIDYVCPLAI